MKKVLLFSLFLVLGLVVSQMLPAMVGEQYSLVKTISNTFLFICLAFIMINVGREFEIDKTRWKSYTEDYFIAMATAAFPWIFVALYYMFVLLPGDLWGSWDAWKENLLLSRFAAPTSAGILFTMLAAAGLKPLYIRKYRYWRSSRLGYDPVDDPVANHDDRLALAIGGHYSGCGIALDPGLEENGIL